MTVMIRALLKDCIDVLSAYENGWSSYLAYVPFSFSTADPTLKQKKIECCQSLKEYLSWQLEQPIQDNIAILSNVLQRLQNEKKTIEAHRATNTTPPGNYDKYLEVLIGTVEYALTRMKQYPSVAEPKTEESIKKDPRLILENGIIYYQIMVERQELVIKNALETIDPVKHAHERKLVRELEERLHNLKLMLKNRTVATIEEIKEAKEKEEAYSCYFKAVEAQMGLARLNEVDCRELAKKDQLTRFGEILKTIDSDVKNLEKYKAIKKSITLEIESNMQQAHSDTLKLFSEMSSPANLAERQKRIEEEQSTATAYWKKQRDDADPAKIAAAAKAKKEKEEAETKKKIEEEKAAAAAKAKKEKEAEKTEETSSDEEEPKPNKTDTKQAEKPVSAHNGNAVASNSPTIAPATSPAAVTPLFIAKVNGSNGNHQKPANAASTSEASSVSTAPVVVSTVNASANGNGANHHKKHGNGKHKTKA